MVLARKVLVAYQEQINQLFLVFLFYRGDSVVFIIFIRVLDAM